MFSRLWQWCYHGSSKWRPKRFDFARYFNIQIINIFDGIDISRGPFEGKESIKLRIQVLNGMEYSEAIQKIISELEKNNYGRSC